MKKIAAYLVFTAALVGCGPLPPDAVDDGNDGEAVDGASDDAIGEGDIAGPDAPDEPIGVDLALEDPLPEGCGDDCEDIPENPVLVDVADDDGDESKEEATDDAETPPHIMLTGPAAGSHMITKTYAGFHVHASSTSALISIPPHGGVADDALHPYRNPAGTIPPGHSVTVVDAAPHGSFMKVKYASKTGYVATSKLAYRGSLGRVAFAMQSGVRNAFFKHQIRRSKWNKDGPLHSGNCAPTSLAMAALVFGAETANLSVEQSIHRIRHKYDAGLHESNGTTRAQIAAAAADIGMHVHGLNTDVSPSAALTRLKGQLNLGRVVVLVGEPGKPNAGPTIYEKAFNRAYAHAIANGASLAHSTYNFNGHHAILVLGRDGNGNYVVGDPLSEVGFIALTPNEMKDFMTRYSGNRGTGNAVWK